MTFEQNIKEWLIGNGMFAAQAVEVIELAKKDESLEALADRWTDDIEACPVTLMAAIRFSVKRIALEWIDANLPKALYRSLFTN